MTIEKSCVLLVEFDVLVRHPLAEYLRECGYRVFEASGTTEARQLLDNANMQIDVVLADAANSSQDSFALAGWVRANHPGIEMMLAGSTEKATQKAGELCEEGPELSKPYDHQLVLGHIRRQLAARKRQP